MLIILIATCLLSALILAKGDRIEAPHVLLVFVWFLVSLLDEYLEFYEISYEVQLLVSMSLSAFCIGFWAPNIKPSISSAFDSKAIDRSLNITLTLLVILLPFFVGFVFSLVSFEFTNILAIRDAMTELNQYGRLPILISIGLNIPIIASVFYTCTSNNLKKRLLLLYIVSGLYVALSFSKGYILQFSIPIFVALYFTKKVSASSLLTSAIFLALLLLTLTAYRDSGVDPEIIFKMYTVAPTAALDTIVTGASPLNRPHYKIFSPLYSLFDAKVTDNLDTFWSDVDVPTNVFTAFGLIYNDLGFFLTLVCFFAYGICSKISYLYVARSKSPTAIFMLSWSYFGVVTSFFSDGFLGMANTNYKYLILLLILEKRFLVIR